MDSHPVCASAEKRSHHWRSYKLIIDPALKKGSHKLYRYDGHTFSMPNPGIPPVDIVRDPRIGRLWTKYKETDLPVPKFKIDECYIGPVPPKEVTFARLNDNIREGFLTEMCKKYGEIEEVEILYNPKNKKHLGIAKVVFESVKAAKVAVQSLHNTSVMGNIIHVELDPKGENRLRYYQLLMNGSYTPRTLPVGGEEAREVSPRSLAEALLACEPIRRLSESSVSAVGGTLPPSSSTTPLSLETGYSSLRQDTPQSQGTPHTPRQTGTPFSQDSSYSSRQSTPAYQSSRPESSGGYKSRRHESKFQDAYNRRPERPQYRSMYRSTTSEQAPFKQHQLTPPEPPPSTSSFTYTAPPPATPNFKSAFSPYQTPLPPAFPPSEPAFHHPAQREGEYLRPQQPPLAAGTDLLPPKERPETPPIPEPPPEPVPHPTTPPPQTPEHCPSPGSPTLDPERNSLDSRIEMLLKEKRTKLLPFLDDRDSDTEVQMEGSPISSSSSQLSPIPPYTSGSQGGQQNSRPTSTGLEDISPTPLPDSEDEEPIPGTASLIKRIGSPVHEKMSNSDLKGGHFRGHTPTDKMDTAHHSSGEDMEISDDEMPGTPITSGDCGKGIVVNSAVSPMQTIPIPPPGFPPLPHQAGFPIPHHHLAPHSAVPGHPSHLAGHPGVPHHMLAPMGPYPHSMMPLVQMELMNCLRWEQWSTVPMSFQMQQQMLSRIAQTRGPYPYPHFMDSGASGPFGGPYQPLSMGGAPASGGTGAPGQQWQHPSIPKFNPTVPPPGYETKKEDPHKATVDGVLLVIVKELKAIMKRDLNRKMVEVVAFRAFDEWWDKKERSAKASLTPVKGAEGKEEERPRLKETMGSSLLENWNKGDGLAYEGMGLGLSLRGTIRLPSFKVKRKDPPEAAAASDNKRARPSTPVDDELEEEDRDRDPAELPSEDSKIDSDGMSAKRRHSRPLKLDSEGEEEMDTSGKEEESLSDREEEPDETEAAHRLSSGKESDDEDGDDEDNGDSSSESGSSDSSDEEPESSASSDSSAGENSSEYEYESEFEVHDNEEEEEGLVEDDVEDEGKEAETSSTASEFLSSDEEKGEAEAKPPSPPAGPVLEDKEDKRSREELSSKLKHRPPSPKEEVMEDLKPPLLTGIPVKEEDISVNSNIPVVKSEPQEHVANLRPPTPTCPLPDSDQEMKAKGKTEPEEVACTPGRLAPPHLDSDTPVPKSISTYLMHLPLPAHPTVESRSLLHPASGLLPDLPQRARIPTDEDIPRTPGRDLMERVHILGKSQSTDTVPNTPGSDAPLTGSSLLLSSPHIPGSPFSYPAQSPVLSAGIPRTPGRDLTFTPVFPDPTAVTLNRKISSESLDDRPVFKEPPISTLPNQALSAGTEHSVSIPEDLPAGITIDVPVPSDTASSRRKPGRPKGKKISAVTAADDSLELSSEFTPLPHDTHLGDLSVQMMSVKSPEHPSLDFQGREVEPRTVLPAEDGFLSYEEERPVAVKPPRRARRGWEELLLDSLSPVTTPPRPYFTPRTNFEEMTILYDIWNEGIDEEDVRLLQITYDKMLQQDNGNDWLNDTLWVNHPPTNIPGVKKKRRDDGMRDHMTGCARSEGYYKIDKKDKIKYLQSTRVQSEEPPVDTQGMSIPAQVHASTRAGSERRSEQRRLLSSFACDSDLLKFNQLKFRKKKIRFCKSHIHDWGLFAMEPIAADEMVIEYVGQNIRQVIADMREKRYEEEGIGSSYMFRVDHDTIIDATKCGNFARFINHSCNPNCYAKVITVESQKKIVIYSRQPININEEITYDYKFPIEDEKIPCLCGAENCRGTLN
nr:histone-lysine N-methyltransferase SETD1B isoform X2 [Monopterus albus]XP_020441414.1 histone-lysine N-methyltransferase SETD1B isoform X2 [Monopterus albus]XP_020441415.1 histone-lysine N-methyltransferase SETD1B isoform X2 [Monopterus albus]XP_020441416.1 histone-lysine N-methyltransferase SETD1B isoform X2 [Monopterus albus]